MKRIHTAIAVVLLSATPLALAQSAGPSDAQIAAIVVTANQVDIDAGKLAESKSANKDVKAFGKQMVTDHTGVNKAATDLVTKLKVKPEDNATRAEPEEGRPGERRQPEDAEGRRVRQGVRRPRGAITTSR